MTNNTNNNGQNTKISENYCLKKNLSNTIDKKR